MEGEFPGRVGDLDREPGDAIAVGDVGRRRVGMDLESRVGGELGGHLPDRPSGRVRGVPTGEVGSCVTGVVDSGDGADRPVVADPDARQLEDRHEPDMVSGAVGRVHLEGIRPRLGRSGSVGCGPRELQRQTTDGVLDVGGVGHVLGDAVAVAQRARTHRPRRRQRRCRGRACVPRPHRSGSGPRGTCERRNSRLRDVGACTRSRRTATGVPIRRWPGRTCRCRRPRTAPRGRLRRSPSPRRLSPSRPCPTGRGQVGRPLRPPRRRPPSRSSRRPTSCSERSGHPRAIRSGRRRTRRGRRCQRRRFPATTRSWATLRSILRTRCAHCPPLHDRTRQMAAAGPASAR